MFISRMLMGLVALCGIGRGNLPPGAERAVQRRERPPAPSPDTPRSFWGGRGWNLPSPNDPFWAKACREENARRKKAAWDHRHRSLRAAAVIPGHPARRMAEPPRRARRRMTWPLVLYPEEHRFDEQHPCPIGACWFEDMYLKHPSLSPKYRRDHAGKRLPIVVMLPDRTCWCVDTLARNDGGYYGDGWTVTGELPRISVSPSIHIPGRYHGFIQDGVITDDMENRKYL